MDGIRHQFPGRRSGVGTANYGFVNRISTSGGAGIPGGVSGGGGYQAHAVFYVGVRDVEATLQEAERLGGKRRMGPERAPTAW